MQDINSSGNVDIILSLKPMKESSYHHWVSCLAPQRLQYPNAVLLLTLLLMTAAQHQYPNTKNGIDMGSSFILYIQITGMVLNAFSSYLSEAFEAKRGDWFLLLITQYNINRQYDYEKSLA